MCIIIWCKPFDAGKIGIKPEETNPREELVKPSDSSLGQTKESSKGLIHS
jgi:hypothetical protein